MPEGVPAMSPGGLFNRSKDGIEKTPEWAEKITEYPQIPFVNWHANMP